jgi:hypothetical protein
MIGGVAFSTTDLCGSRALEFFEYFPIRYVERKLLLFDNQVASIREQSVPSRLPIQRW